MFPAPVLPGRETRGAPKGTSKRSHIRMTRRQPNANTRWDWDHRCASSAAMMRTNATVSTSAPIRSKRPFARTTSMLLMNAGCDGATTSGAGAAMATGTNVESGLTDPAASLRQRYSKLCATPCRRATAETFAPRTRVSSTIDCFSDRLHIRRAATTVKSREVSCPDVGTDLSPSTTNNRQTEPALECARKAVLAGWIRCLKVATRCARSAWDRGPCPARTSLGRS